MVASHISLGCGFGILRALRRIHFRVWPSVRQLCMNWILSAAEICHVDGPASRNALMLVAIAVAVRPDGFVGHVARAAFDAVVNAHLAHRTERFVIKRRHPQSGT